MKHSFRKEEKGDVVQVVIILAVILIISSFIFTGLKNKSKEATSKTNGNYSNAMTSMTAPLPPPPPPRPPVPPAPPIAVDTTPPATVTHLTETHTSTTANLSWTNPTDADFNHVNIYRDNVLVAASSNGTYTYDGASGSTTYDFRLTSVDNNGNESIGASISVTTNAPPIPPDTTPPTNVTNLHETHTANSVILAWSNPTDSDFSKVNIYQNGGFIGTSINGTYTASNLSSSTLYNFKVTSVDRTGNESTGITISATTSAPPDTTPPANVTNLHETHTATSVTLTWTNPTDSDFSNVKIYRDYTYNGTSTNGTYANSGLTASTTYTYKVTSVDRAGNESIGTTISATTSAPPDTTPPANVTNLHETHTAGSVTLTWTNPTDSDFSNVKIYRNNTYMGTSTNGTYTNSGLTASTTYTYKVTSIDRTGNESIGTTISATTSPQCPALPTYDVSLSLRQPYINSYAHEYQIDGTIVEYDRYDRGHTYTIRTYVYSNTTLNLTSYSTSAYDSWYGGYDAIAIKDSFNRTFVGFNRWEPFYDDWLSQMESSNISPAPFTNGAINVIPYGEGNITKFTEITGQSLACALP